MPYIKQEDRKRFDCHIDALIKEFDKKPVSPGEFNYVVSRLLWNIWMKESNHNYTTANNLIGALECIKEEFYRRWIAPYEEDKIKENGDVEFLED